MAGGWPRRQASVVLLSPLFSGEDLPATLYLPNRRSDFTQDFPKRARNTLVLSLSNRPEKETI
jgi:hypothetical protein